MAPAGTDPVSILVPQDRACTETGCALHGGRAGADDEAGAERAGSGASAAGQAGGVYKLHNLTAEQDRGLNLFLGARSTAADRLDPRHRR